jgi:FAD/FMN-containing dehydrogenase
VSPATRSASASAGTRDLGLSSNGVTASELVAADGGFRRVDREHEPDLFWAFRGGGGNFGIVTALEMQLYSIPESTPASSSTRWSARQRSARLA